MLRFVVFPEGALVRGLIIQMSAVAGLQETVTVHPVALPTQGHLECVSTLDVAHVVPIHYQLH
jgi:hypothetical protein